MLQITFNPGLTLTDFRKTRPWRKNKMFDDLTRSLIKYPSLILQSFNISQDTSNTLEKFERTSVLSALYKYTL